MGKILSRVVSDHTEVGDDTTPQSQVREFCLLCHVHFMALDIEDARAKLAHYFNSAADDDKADRMFNAGQMTLGAALVVHQPQVDSEVKH